MYEWGCEWVGGFVCVCGGEGIGGGGSTAGRVFGVWKEREKKTEGELQ